MIDRVCVQPLDHQGTDPPTNNAMYPTVITGDKESAAPPNDRDTNVSTPRGDITQPAHRSARHVVGAVSAPVRRGSSEDRERRDRHGRQRP